MADRITATHLKRAAIVYVRQSSPEQVRNHAESTRIQLGLRDKAIAFGWQSVGIINGVLEAVLRWSAPRLAAGGART